MHSKKNKEKDAFQELKSTSVHLEQSIQKDIQPIASKITVFEEHFRRQIAAEIHDRIIQNLGWIKLRLNEYNLAKSPIDKKTAMADISTTLENTIKESRLLIEEFNPPFLLESNIVKAIEWMAKMRTSSHKIRCEVHDDRKPKPLAFEVKIILFQATRELIINSLKHASPSKITINIERIKELIIICVKDNGIGFNQSAVPDISHENADHFGFGLNHIRERMKLISGTLDIKSSIGHGSKITLMAPLQCG